MTDQNRVDPAAELPAAEMSAAEMPEDTYSTYDLFILAISILSLVVLAIMVVPWSSEDTIRIAFTLDSVISVIFLFDFFHSLRQAPDRGGYFKHGGWLDLLGSVPAVPILRLFRLARVFRIIRTLHRIGLREVLRVYRSNLADSAFLTTLLVMILLLSISSLLIVRIESAEAEAQITNSSDALWWSLVTVTTVGYGDLVPVTDTGRFLASMLMTVGVAFVSVLTGYFTSKLYLSGDQDVQEEPQNPELAHLNERIDKLSAQLERAESLLLQYTEQQAS